MKSLMGAILVLSIQSLATSAQADFFESRCSNAESTVNYHRKDFSAALSVAVRPPVGNFQARGLLQTYTVEDYFTMSPQPEMRPVTDFVAEEISPALIINAETLVTKACDETPVGQRIEQKKELSVLKIQFQKVDGSSFDSDIIALDEGGKSITVDYICNSVEETTIACNL